MSGFSLLISAISLFALASNSGCAPVPRSDRKAGSKPFLDELKFVDQKSLKVIHYEEGDERSCARLIFSADSIDFDHKNRLSITKDVPSQALVELIEQVSTYKFRQPNALSIGMSMSVGKFEDSTFHIVADGESYVVHCLYRLPKAKPGSTPTTETKK